MWDWRKSHPAPPAVFQLRGYGLNLPREKNEKLPNDPAMVLTKPQTRPNPNVHFSWSLAGVLLPPELAFSPTW